MRYRADITAGALRVPGSRIIAALLLRGLDDRGWQEANRVRQGGHPVPDPVIRRRFVLGIRNFFTLYRPLLDSWMLFDNSTSHPHLIAHEEFGQLYIAQARLYETIKRDAEGGPS